MSFLSRILGHKPAVPTTQDAELKARCDEVLSSEQLSWAKPYLDNKAQRDEEARQTESNRQREKRILAAQQARKENRAPLFEVMAVPEDERTESENQWVKDYLEIRSGRFKNLD